MTDDLEFIRQTFNATELEYDTEPALVLPDPLADPPPTPGFYRRASNKPPKGSVPLFEMDEIPPRTEYDH